MIAFKDVHFTYPNGKKILNGVSFRLNKGDHASLMGLSGCGKSTIVALACGFLKPQSGEVSILDHNIANISSKDKKHLYQNLGVSFQQGGLFHSMLVKDNLCFAMEKMRGWNTQEQHRRVDYYLKEMNLEHAANKYPHELSGGMRRRVSLARALCTDPHLAILDNPTAGLDPISSHQILTMIRSLAKQSSHSTVLCLTSHVEMGMSFASRAILLHENTIIADDSWTKMLEDTYHHCPWIKTFLTVEFKGCSKQKLQKIGFPESYINSNHQPTLS
ncbi:MAG: ATP-binding cassette domain-containing protein [Proteobacteria bacterium]|nr:ATP-binding cassette domain-containing protein [Pseudomonadota bacterium]